MHKGIKVVLIIIGIVVLLEVIGLVWLVTSVGRYHTFWATKAQESGDMTYLALGDSTAQGIGASSPSRGYVGQIEKRLEQKTGKSVRVINLSKSGATMEDYLKEQAPQIGDIKADIVTIEIGANDIRTFNAQSFRANFVQVLATLPDGTFVSNMPLFNSRPGSTDNGKLASIIIAEELAKRPRLIFVDLQKQTTDNQSIFGFAPDLFHPNNRTYKHWADAFWQQIDKQ